MMKHNPDFVAREISSELVLVPVTRDAADLESVFTLNEVAACVWRLLETCSSDAEIARELSKEYEVEQEEALADVQELLTQLREIGAVVED